MFALVISEELFKCMHHLPKVHRHCSCKTFWSTFLVQLFERVCCLYMPPHFTIKWVYPTLCTYKVRKMETTLWRILSYIRHDDFRSKFVRPSITLRGLPPLDSETWWTGELWSNCVVLMFEFFVCILCVFE